MKRAELVPDEVCTACGVPIGPKNVACIWEGAIVCHRCMRAMGHKKHEEEYRHRPATPEQIAFLRRLRIKFDPRGLELENASKMIDTGLQMYQDWRMQAERNPVKFDRVKHYINGFIVHATGRHVTENRIDQLDVRNLAAWICIKQPNLAKDINALISRKEHSEDFLQDTDVFLAIRDLLRQWWIDEYGPPPAILARNQAIAQSTLGDGSEIVHVEVPEELKDT
jgi:hypothetical protein